MNNIVLHVVQCTPNIYELPLHYGGREGGGCVLLAEIHCVIKKKFTLLSTWQGWVLGKFNLGLGPLSADNAAVNRGTYGLTKINIGLRTPTADN